MKCPQHSRRMKRLWKDPRRNSKMLKACRENVKLATAAAALAPRSKKQLEAWKKAQKVLDTLPKTWLEAKNRTRKQRRADFRNVRLANSLPRNTRQLLAVRESIKLARIGLKKRRKEKNGICEICGIHCFSYRDHDHKTGKHRGTLCFNHNFGIGMFKDNPKMLRKAASYLEKYQVRRFPRLKILRFPRLAETA